MQAPSQLPEQLWPTRAVYREVVQTVLPQTAALSSEEWEAMERLVHDTLQRRSGREIRQLNLFLRLIQWTSLLRHGATFTSLDLPRRQRVLEYLQDHPLQLIRSGFWGLRTLAFLGYYGRPEVSSALGYRPDARGWEARP